MTDRTTPNKNRPFSSKHWVWISVGISILLVLVAIIFPFVQNYRAIKRIYQLGGYVAIKPGLIYTYLPQSCIIWLAEHVEHEYLYAANNVYIVSINKYENYEDLKGSH